MNYLVRRGISGIKLTQDINKDGTEILTNSIADIVKTKTKSRFDAAVTEVITDLLFRMMQPWVEHCFSTYSEPYFHMKMTTGFDFIRDWKVNHKTKYAAIVGGLRRIRNKIDLNEDVLLDAVLKSLAKYGWNIEEWEKTRFRSNISTLIVEIYS